MGRRDRSSRKPSSRGYTNKLREEIFQVPALQIGKSLRLVWFVEYGRTIVGLNLACKRQHSVATDPRSQLSTSVLPFLPVLAAILVTVVVLTITGEGGPLILRECVCGPKSIAPFDHISI